ncbi:MAG: type II toxin-antitoxin system HicA family toxin [Chloroflexi bacterium]|nr:type II toxin-antitoxin system HicA family toxin [Chloroflexota bacterium]
MQRVLRAGGWEKVRQTGSHAFFKHPTKLGIVTVPMHSGETLGIGLTQKILKLAGLTSEDMQRLDGG